MNGEDKNLLQPIFDFVRILSRLMATGARRWPIVAFTVMLCLLASVGAGRLSQPQYSSDMLIMAAPAQQTGMASSLSSSLAGARSSIQALGLGGLGGSSQFKAYLQLMQSNAVAEAIMSNPRDMDWLIGQSIDPRTGQYKVGPWSPRALLYGLFGLTPPTRPTVQDIQQILNRMIVINLNADNQDIATVSCTSTVAEACTQLLMDVHRATEAHLSGITLADAKRLKIYLDGILPTVQEQVVRDSLVDLLASATRQIAISELHQPVGAVVISPPYMTTQPSFPRPSLLIAAAFAIGLLFGMILAWLLPPLHAPFRVGQRVRRLRARFTSPVA